MEEEIFISFEKKHLVKENKSFIKCSVCGKFMSPTSEEVMVNFTPDSELSEEEVEWVHIKCNKK